jgi:uncharacterized peroxidase-related enzyme
MAWIQVIDEQEATGDLKEIYDEILDARGKMSNIMRIQSLHPKAMRAHMDLYLSVVYGRSKLRRPDRELLATVVSALNDCAYCTQHHAEALRFYWKDGERIERVLDDYATSDLSPAQKTMLDYAVKLTRAPSSVGPEDVQALRSVDFTDREILDINLIVGYFNFVNRIATGLGVEFSEEELSGYNF